MFITDCRRFSEPTFGFIAAFAQQILIHVTSDPVREFMLPVARKLQIHAERAYKEEDRLRTHPEEVDEGIVAEVRLFCCL